MTGSYKMVPKMFLMTFPLFIQLDSWHPPLFKSPGFMPIRFFFMKLWLVLYRIPIPFLSSSRTPPFWDIRSQSFFLPKIPFVRHAITVFSLALHERTVRLLHCLALIQPVYCREYASTCSTLLVVAGRGCTVLVAVRYSWRYWLMVLLLVYSTSSSARACVVVSSAWVYGLRSLPSHRAGALVEAKAR